MANNIMIRANNPETFLNDINMKGVKKNQYIMREVGVIIPLKKRTILLKLKK
jgi:hypothetical protein